MIVPDSWNKNLETLQSFDSLVVATYRVKFTLPQNIEDPAIKLRRATRAMEVFANGELIAQIGKVSENFSDYKPGYEIKIMDLPKNETIDLVVWVSNLDYYRGGLRESFIVGSKEVILRQHEFLLGTKLVVI
jgi:hypothetical protein